jgi:hypothetical protein
MKQLPNEHTLAELLSMGKNLEDRARKIYEMSIAFTQKYEQKLQKKQPNGQEGATIISMPKIHNKM